MDREFDTTEPVATEKHCCPLMKCSSKTIFYAALGAAIGIATCLLTGRLILEVIQKFSAGE